MARVSINRFIASLTEYKGLKKRDFLTEAPDIELKRLTRTFPFKVEKTHPIFILTANVNGAIACPCTRNPNKKDRYRYIHKGCLRSGSNPFPIDRTYLLEDCSFPLPRDSSFIEYLEYKGNVPADAISGFFRGEWR